MKKIDHDMFLGAGGHLFEIARNLRAHETQAEQFLWSRLCSNQLGVRFRRQHPIYDYVADFYCHSHRIVIEVDGSVHNSDQASFDDSVRSRAFEEFNIKVMRFTNNDVLFAIEEVIRKIKFYLYEYHQDPPSPCLPAAALRRWEGGPGGFNQTNPPHVTPVE